MDLFDADLLNYSLNRLDEQIQAQERISTGIPSTKARQLLRYIRDVFDVVDRAESRWRRAIANKPINQKLIKKIENDIFRELIELAKTRDIYNGKTN